MATFKYISKDMSAKTIRGTLEADDRNDLVRKLKEQNLFLVSCQDVTKKTVNQYKMKLNELSAYSREIGTMLASGLSSIRIFSIMVRREDNKKIKKIYEIIYVFLTIFLYLLKCPQSLILSALRAFCFCGKPHISRSIFLYFRYQAWLKSW